MAFKSSVILVVLLFGTSQVFGGPCGACSCAPPAPACPPPKVYNSEANIPLPVPSVIDLGTVCQCKTTKLRPTLVAVPSCSPLPPAPLAPAPAPLALAPAAAPAPALLSALLPALAPLLAAAPGLTPDALLKALAPLLAAPGCLPAPACGC